MVQDRNQLAIYQLFLMASNTSKLDLELMMTSYKKYVLIILGIRVLQVFVVFLEITEHLQKKCGPNNIYAQTRIIRK